MTTPKVSPARSIAPATEPAGDMLWTTGVVVVTDRRQAEGAGRRLVDVVAGAVDGGAGAVLVREKDLPEPDRARLVDRLRTIATGAGAGLIVAGDLDLAVATGADGVHLAADDPWPTDDGRARLRPAARRRPSVSRSCHSVDELVAARGRADWVTFSPVFPTSSKPGYGPALGPAGLADGCRRVPDLAIAALGGVDATTARACVRAGADAVAVMGAVMRADAPREAVARIVAAVDAARDERAASASGTTAVSP